MRRARYECLDDGEGYYGEISGLDGLWASAPSLDGCREELTSALEDWVVAGLQLGHELPSPAQNRRASDASLAVSLLMRTVTG